MLKLNFRLIVRLLTILFAGSSSSALASRVNFQALNPVHNFIVQEVIRKDDMVVRAAPWFDEKFSDLESERLRYHLSGDLKNAPWEKHEAKFMSTSTYETERSAFRSGIWIKANLVFDTDILAAARHGGLKALEEGAAKEFVDHEDEAKKMLQGLSKVKSMPKLFEILQKSRQLAESSTLASIKLRRQALRQSLAGEALEGERSYSGELSELVYEEQEIEDRILTLEAMRQQPPFKFDSAEGQISSSLPNPGNLLATAAESVEPESVEVVLSPKRMQISLDFFVALEKSELDDLTKTLSEVLGGVEAGNKEQKDRLRNSYREALISFKRAIRNRKQNGD